MGIRKAVRNLFRGKGSEKSLHEMLGVNFYHDVKRLVPGCPMNHVFDVGANVGLSTIEIATHFPNARIYCFEPVLRTFEKLRNATADLENVSCVHCALGDEVARRRMTAKGTSGKNHLVSDGDSDGETEGVDVTTLDAFCRQHAIDHVGYVRIDTEGNDLNVLKGAYALLKAGRIDFLEVEAGMNPSNAYHVPIEDFKAYLEPLGYYLFGIYEQKSEWRQKEKYLRRADVAFMRKDLSA
jgi:FkbM family methyltransferase